MIKVGITGGIGSGKTSACQIFEWLGVPVYYADTRAKYLMENDPHLCQSIKDSFGSDIYDVEGKLRRKQLASIVFNNTHKLELLNSLVHPAVFKDSAKWMKLHSNNPYTLKEAALLIESGSFKILDKLIVVSAPQHIRIERVMHRDKVSESEVRARMKNQLSEEKKLALADIVIYNDGRQLMLPQVISIHRKILSGSNA